MGSVKIVTDSTMDVPTDVLKDYNIEVIPLSFNIDGEIYLDRIEITPMEFIKKMSTAKEIPKTSQPPIGEFIELYDQLGADGTSILSIHMTSGMSGTYSTACTAANLSSSHVEVIDSTFMSQATGFQVLEAGRMAKEGCSIEEIIARVEKMKETTTLFVVVDTLDNLVKGGRIGKGAALIGSLLHIKPIAKVENGVYEPIAKVRSHNQVIKTLVNHFKEDTKGKTVKAVGISHADAMDLSLKLKAAIIEACGFTDITIYDTTPVISTHTGVGAIGFSYFAE